MMIMWLLYGNKRWKIKLQVYSRFILSWHIVEEPVELYVSVAGKLLYYPILDPK